jgi:hypothetical protein
VETQLVSVERVMEYSELYQEGPYTNEAEKYSLFPSHFLLKIICTILKYILIIIKTDQSQTGHQRER